MTTIKSFTSLEQSRKLAEILPLESADMYYHYNTSVVKNYHEDIPNIIQLNNHFAFFYNDIPCWSLAALLGVLPKGTRLLKSTTDDTYHCDCLKGNVDEWYDNPVDACYEMILKLHELNLL